MFQIRDMYKLWFSVLEVLTCKFYDLFCFLSCCTCIKFNEIGIWHLADWRSCDEFCMEAFGKRSKCRENTLNVNYDCLTGTCQYNVLLL